MFRCLRLRCPPFASAGRLSGAVREPSTIQAIASGSSTGEPTPASLKGQGSDGQNEAHLLTGVVARYSDGSRRAQHGPGDQFPDHAAETALELPIH